MRTLTIGLFVTAVATLPLTARADWNDVKQEGAQLQQKGKDLQHEGQNLQERANRTEERGKALEQRGKTLEKKGEHARDEAASDYRKGEAAGKGVSRTVHRTETRRTTTEEKK